MRVVGDWKIIVNAFKRYVNLTESKNKKYI